jgi:hypothetical protein
MFEILHRNPVSDASLYEAIYVLVQFSLHFLFNLKQYWNQN